MKKLCVLTVLLITFLNNSYSQELSLVKKDNQLTLTKTNKIFVSEDLISHYGIKKTDSIVNLIEEAHNKQLKIKDERGLKYTNWGFCTNLQIKSTYLSIRNNTLIKKYEIENNNHISIDTVFWFFITIVALIFIKKSKKNREFATFVFILAILNGITFCLIYKIANTYLLESLVLISFILFLSTAIILIIIKNLFGNLITKVFILGTSLSWFFAIAIKTGQFIPLFVYLILVALSQKPIRKIKDTIKYYNYFNSL